MVEIVFEDIKKIVVHEVIEHKLNDLIKIRVGGLRPDSTALPLVWADGVVFSKNAMPLSEDVVKQQLEGIVHFQAVEWALMPKYRRFLKSGGVSIPVVNASKNPTLIELAKTLKKRHKS